MRPQALLQSTAVVGKGSGAGGGDGDSARGVCGESLRDSTRAKASSGSSDKVSSRDGDGSCGDVGEGDERRRRSRRSPLGAPSAAPVSGDGSSTRHVFPPSRDSGGCRVNGGKSSRGGFPPRKSSSVDEKTLCKLRIGIEKFRKHRLQRFTQELLQELAAPRDAKINNGKLKGRDGGKGTAGKGGIDEESEGEGTGTSSVRAKGKLKKGEGSGMRKGRTRGQRRESSWSNNDPYDRGYDNDYEETTVTPCSSSRWSGRESLALDSDTNGEGGGGAGGLHCLKDTKGPQSPEEEVEEEENRVGGGFARGEPGDEYEYMTANDYGNADDDDDYPFCSVREDIAGVSVIEGLTEQVIRELGGEKGDGGGGDAKRGDDLYEKISVSSSVREDEEPKKGIDSVYVSETRCEMENKGDSGKCVLMPTVNITVRLTPPPSKEEAVNGEEGEGTSGCTDMGKSGAVPLQETGRRSGAERQGSSSKSHRKHRDNLTSCCFYENVDYNLRRRLTETEARRRNDGASRRNRDSSSSAAMCCTMGAGSSSSYTASSGSSMETSGSRRPTTTRTEVKAQVGAPSQGPPPENPPENPPDASSSKDYQMHRVQVGLGPDRRFAQSTAKDLQVPAPEKTGLHRTELLLDPHTRDRQAGAGSNKESTGVAGGARKCVSEYHLGNAQPEPQNPYFLPRATTESAVGRGESGVGGGGSGFGGGLSKTKRFEWIFRTNNPSPNLEVPSPADRKSKSKPRRYFSGILEAFSATSPRQKSIRVAKGASSAPEAGEGVSRKSLRGTKKNEIEERYGKPVDGATGANANSSHLGTDSARSATHAKHQTELARNTAAQNSTKTPQEYLSGNTNVEIAISTVGPPTTYTYTSTTTTATVVLTKSSATLSPRQQKKGRGAGSEGGVGDPPSQSFSPVSSAAVAPGVAKSSSTSSADCPSSRGTASSVDQAQGHGAVKWSQGRGGVKVSLSRDRDSAALYENVSFQRQHSFGHKPSRPREVPASPRLASKATHNSDRSAQEVPCKVSSSPLLASKVTHNSDRSAQEGLCKVSSSPRVTSKVVHNVDRSAQEIPSEVVSSPMVTSKQTYNLERSTQDATSEVTSSPQVTSRVAHNLERSTQEAPPAASTSKRERQVIFSSKDGKVVVDGISLTPSPVPKHAKSASISSTYTNDSSSSTSSSSMEPVTAYMSLSRSSEDGLDGEGRFHSTRSSRSSLCSSSSSILEFHSVMETAPLPSPRLKKKNRQLAEANAGLASTPSPLVEVSIPAFPTSSNKGSFPLPEHKVRGSETGTTATGPTNKSEPILQGKPDAGRDPGKASVISRSKCYNQKDTTGSAGPPEEVKPSPVRCRSEKVTCVSQAPREQEEGGGRNRSHQQGVLQAPWHRLRQQQSRQEQEVASSAWYSLGDAPCRTEKLQEVSTDSLSSNRTEGGHNEESGSERMSSDGEFGRVGGGGGGPTNRETWVSEHTSAGVGAGSGLQTKAETDETVEDSGATFHMKHVNAAVAAAAVLAAAERRMHVHVGSSASSPPSAKDDSLSDIWEVKEDSIEGRKNSEARSSNSYSCGSYGSNNSSSSGSHLAHATPCLVVTDTDSLSSNPVTLGSRQDSASKGRHSGRDDGSVEEQNDMPEAKEEVVASSTDTSRTASYSSSRGSGIVHAVPCLVTTDSSNRSSATSASDTYNESRGGHVKQSARDEKSRYVNIQSCLRTKSASIEKLPVEEENAEEPSARGIHRSFTHVDLREPESVQKPQNVRRISQIRQQPPIEDGSPAGGAAGDEDPSDDVSQTGGDSSVSTGDKTEPSEESSVSACPPAEENLKKPQGVPSDPQMREAWERHFGAWQWHRAIWEHHQYLHHCHMHHPHHPPPEGHHYYDQAAFADVMNHLNHGWECPGAGFASNPPPWPPPHAAPGNRHADGTSSSSRRSPSPDMSHSSRSQHQSRSGREYSSVPRDGNAGSSCSFGRYRSRSCSQRRSRSANPKYRVQVEIPLEGGVAPKDWPEGAGAGMWYGDPFPLFTGVSRVPSIDEDLACDNSLDASYDSLSHNTLLDSSQDPPKDPSGSTTTTTTTAPTAATQESRIYIPAQDRHPAKTSRRLAERKKAEGNELYKAKDYRQALVLYAQAIELCPDCAAYYSNRSACLMMLGRYADALVDAREAVRLDATFVKGYIRVAKCNIALGDATAALSVLRQAEEMEPHNRSIRDEMNNAQKLNDCLAEVDKLAARNEYRTAIYRIDCALNHAVGCFSLKIRKAEYLVFLQRFGDAQEIVNEILLYDNSNVDAIYVRGMCLYYQDNQDAAFNHFQHVLRLSPDHQKAKEIYKKAKALRQKKEEGNDAFKRGAFADADKLYTEALAIDPLNKHTCAKLYFNRATVNSKLEKLEAAVEDCTAAINLDEGYVKAYLRRAKCYQGLDKHQEAVRDYEKVFKIDKNQEHKRLLVEAKVQLKRSKRKDYYKILGVDKSATEDEIKKSYRKMALVHHPDRHASASKNEKHDHEVKFKEIGEAYSVLTDAKKRAMYDRGHDFNDPSPDGGGFPQDGEIDPNQIFQAFFSGTQGGFNFTGGPGGGFQSGFPGGFHFQFG